MVTARPPLWASYYTLPSISALTGTLASSAPTTLAICAAVYCLPSVVEACVVRYFQTEARYAYRTAVLQL